MFENCWSCFAAEQFVDIRSTNVKVNGYYVTEKVKYFLCTDRKYLTFFWKIFHYNYPGIKVRYIQQQER